MSALHFAFSWPIEVSSEVQTGVNDLLRAARAESLSTRDLCGESTNGGRLWVEITRYEDQ